MSSLIKEPSHMKKLLKSFLCLSLLTVVAVQADCETTCTSIFNPHSAGTNIVRQASYNNYRFGEDCFYSDFSISGRFQKSRQAGRIANSMFGDNTLHFQGSSVAAADKVATSLLADNFGLGKDTDAKISFAPKIKNYVVDTQLFLGLDEIYEGLFAQINIPFVHTKWEINETVDGNVGTANFAAGEMNKIADGELAPHDNFTNALNGKALGAIEAWEYGKFNLGKCNDDKAVADLSAKLGLNFYECPDYHVGAFVRTSAPTGTKRDKKYANNLFNAAAGMDHWTLGAGLTGHAELYNCNDEHMINAYFEGYLAHGFKRCQVRTFDLKDKGCLNRYMLLKEFNADNTATGNVVSGTKFGTRNTDVSIGAFGEATLELVYDNSCGFSAGAGAALWGQKCETLEIKDAVADLGDNKYGIKGTEYVEALLYNVDGVGDVTAGEETRFLVSTQNDATINKAGTTDNANALGSQDNDANFYSVDGGTVVVNDSLSEAATIDGDGNIDNDATNQPVTLANKEATFAKDSGRTPSQLSGKVFGHLGYEWTDCDYAPSLRLGGEVEFSSKERAATMNSAAFFIEGGVSF